MGAGIGGDSSDLRTEKEQNKLVEAAKNKEPAKAVRIYTLTDEGKEAMAHLAEIQEKTGLALYTLSVLTHPDYMSIINDLDIGKKIITKHDVSNVPYIQSMNLVDKDALDYFSAIRTFYNNGLIEIKLTDTAKDLLIV